MIRILLDNGQVCELDLERYLEKIQGPCSCLSSEQRICLCSKKDKISEHLALLEEDGFSRARIVDRASYQRDLIALSRKRPVLVRQKQKKEVPF